MKMAILLCTTTPISMEEKLVIAITEHSRFGYVLQPVWVKPEKSGALSILEIVNAKSVCFASLPPVQREIITLSERYSDKALMKVYSKETAVSAFRKNVDEKTVQLYIRPAIERYHQRIIDLLPNSALEVYLREKVAERALYDSEKLQLPSDAAKAVFNFVKKENDTLRYFITIALEDNILNLNGKRFGIICHDPACLFVDKTLLTFKDIDAKKLLPFFSKEYVTVPATSEQAYVEKFIANCVKNNVSINAQGIEIKEINPPCKARLSLTNGLDTLPVLNLDFFYDGKKYPFDTPEKKIVYTKQTNGTTSLIWFYRDKNLENSLVKLLTDNGLEKKWLNGFRVENTNPENGINLLIDWIQAHKEIVNRFDLQQNIAEKTYFLGEIALESALSEKQDWFDIKSIAVFGTFKIPFIRFKNNILNNIREYILPDGSIAILPEEWFTRYYELMFFGKEAADNIRLNRYYAELTDSLVTNAHHPANRHKEHLYPVPEGINGVLRPYQHKGFSWLLHLAENRFGGCLADDMGLGKTLQTIALLQHFYWLRKNSKTRQKLKQAGQLSIFEEDNLIQDVSHNYPPSLVVVPASLLHNWHNELKRFTPDQKVYLYSGDKRVRTKDLDIFFGMFDVILTTYGTLRIDIELLERCSFHYFILDESQFVKNPDSETYKAVMRIQSVHKLALTGTPVENSLLDLWAQLNIVNEGMLGGRQSFQKAYVNPLSRNNKEKEEALLKLIRPFILRRTKEEVAPELPPLTEETVYCDMSESQAEVYNAEKNKLRNLVIESPTIDFQKFTFMAMQGLTKLRLLANHPELLDASYTGDSGKFEQVMTVLETLRESNHKALVFSSFVKHLRLFAGYFDQNGWKYAWLTGSTNVQDREKEINRYMYNQDVNCFFISLKAGGVGLNLTAADYVLILDPWWNPAAENQAVSRSHRIGQDKHVIVYRFISSGTIEEKIRRLQESKSRLAEIFISSSNPLRGMAKEEVENLLE